MLTKKLEKSSVYVVDIGAIEGDGSFACPKCRNCISPDDETESTYKIIDTKLINDELAELDISCGKCGSLIKVVGFQQGINASSH